MAIEVKNLSQLKLMRKAGLVVADTLKLLKQSAQIGMTTLELDEIAANNLAKHGATSSFLGYHGFPAVICASVNEEVVHGIPNKRKLVSGDVLSIDFGAIVDGWHGDAAISFGIGEVEAVNQKLMDVCQGRGRGIPLEVFSWNADKISMAMFPGSRVAGIASGYQGQEEEGVVPTLCQGIKGCCLAWKDAQVGQKAGGQMSGYAV